MSQLEILNPQYDLTCQELVAQCRAQLHTYQTCVLPNFLSKDSIVDLNSFANTEMKHTPHPGVTESTIFYQDVDESFAESHPRNRKVTRSNTYITSDKIPQNLSLRKLGDDSTFQKFLQDVTDEALVEYNCEISKFVFSVSGEGDHQDWHFDNNFLTLTFMLQKSHGGGLLEVYPLIGRDNDRELSEILDFSAYSGPQSSASGPPARKKLVFEYNVGDMILFYGRHSLHRSTAVWGDQKRIIAIISYNTKDERSLPNATHMRKVYGLQM